MRGTSLVSIKEKLADLIHLNWLLESLCLCLHSFWKDTTMLKLAAFALAALMLIGGSSYAVDSIPTNNDSDTLIACCWGGGGWGGNGGGGWGRGRGGWNHGGGGYYGGGYYGG